MKTIAVIDDDVYIGDMLTEVLLHIQNTPVIVLSAKVEVQGEIVKLTRTEFAILKLLMENPKQVIAKSVLLDRISLDTPDCTGAFFKTAYQQSSQKNAGDQRHGLY